MRNKEEKSNSMVSFKLTPKEKEQIKQAAEDRGMSISEFVRFAVEKIFNND